MSAPQFKQRGGQCHFCLVFNIFRAQVQYDWQRIRIWYLKEVFAQRLTEWREACAAQVVSPSLARAMAVLRFYREFTAAQPDELQTWAGILTGPDGDPLVALISCYVGALDAGERLLAPLRRFGSPVADTIAPIPYVTMQSMFDAAALPGRLDYWKTGLTDRLNDDIIAATVEYGRQVPSPLSVMLFIDLHGAYSRVDKTDTAYYHRDLQYDPIALSIWTNPADSECNIRWTRDLFAAWEPHLPAAVYVNDLGDEDEERAQSAYGENYTRLVALKNKYDPTNLFRFNQNIKPTHTTLAFTRCGGPFCCRQKPG